MRNKLLLLSLFVMSFGTISAQDTNLDMRFYNFNDEALKAPMMDSTGYHSCMLWSITYEELVPEGKMTPGSYRLEHELRQINDVRGVEEFNKWYTAAYYGQDLFEIKARVIKDGKEVSSKFKTDLKTVVEENMQYYLIAHEGVEPGCYIETIRIIRSDYSLSSSEYLSYTVPMRYREFNIVSPEHIKYRYKVYNCNIEPKTQVADGRQFLTIKREGNIQVVPTDENYGYIGPYRDRIDYTVESIEGADYKYSRWNDMGNRYMNGVFSNYDKSKSGVKKLLKELNLESLGSEQEKIFAIENYLKTKVTIGQVDTEESAAAIVKKGESSAFGFIRLMMFMFHEAGIPYEVMVTSSRERRLFDKSFDFEDAFSEVLFFFPNSNVYLHPTEEGLRVPHIGFEFYAQDGVRMKWITVGGVQSPVCSVKSIPSNDVTKNAIREEFTVNFINGMSETKVQAYIGYNGQTDQGLRMVCFFVDEDQRKELSEERLKRGLSNSKIENLEIANYNLTSYNEYQQPFEFRADVIGPDLLEFAGDKIIFNIGDVIGPQSQMYNEKPRMFPMDVTFAHSYDRVITLNIPEGYNLKGLEPLKYEVTCKSESGMYCYWKSDYRVEGNQLIVTITESYDSIMIPLEYYDSFKNVINAAADFNKLSVILEKK